MTQKKTHSFPPHPDELNQRRSTRIENAEPDLFDPDKPRIGRRESEPHSAEVAYIYEVLTLNFPNCRTLWDLHHYFLGKKGLVKGKKIDIQYDISFFKDFNIPYTLSSYNANKFEQRIPDLVINVLSKSTWKTDLSENVDICKDLEIPVYVIFSPYKVASKIYNPPFVRVFVLEDDGTYRQEDFQKITLKEDEEIDEKNIIDISSKVPFRLGLMQLKQKHEGGLPLFRLIFIDPSELKIFPSKMDMLKQAEIKAQEAEAKAQDLEKTLKKYRDKFGKLY